MTSSMKKAAALAIILTLGSGCSSQTIVDRLNSMGSQGQLELYHHYMLLQDMPNNQTLAIQHLKNAAQQGNTSAQFTYATALEKLEGRDSAATWYKLASNGGIGHAHVWLGKYFFEKGYIDQSIKYYKMAEKLGFVDAIYALGSIHQNRGEWEQAYTKYLSLELIGYRDADIQAMRVAFNIDPLRALELSGDTRRIR